MPSVLGCSPSGSRYGNVPNELIHRAGPPFLDNHYRGYQYKIVMDNIDKTIKPADMRVNNQTRSLHYVHKFAVRDRLDLSGFDDKPRRPNITDMKIRKMLPSKDETAIHYNMSLLIAQILVENLDFLSSFKRSLGRHFPHQYSQEMSLQSNVVSCCTGIQ